MPQAYNVLPSAVKQMSVFIASRTGAGRTLREAYGYEGGGKSLQGISMFPADIADAPKAKVPLTLSQRQDVDFEPCFAASEGGR